MLAHVLDMDWICVGLGIVCQAMDVDSLTGENARQIKIRNQIKILVLPVQ
jgi:hypothetical protein